MLTDSKIIFSDGKYWLPIMSFTEDNFKKEKLFHQIMLIIGDGTILKECSKKYGFELIWENMIIITVDEGYIGFCLDSKIVALAAYLSMSVLVVINYKPRFTIDEYSYPHTGAYFYAISENTIDISRLNDMAGTVPTCYYQKGDSGFKYGYKVYNHSSWGVELEYNHEMPEKPIQAIMDYIKHPKELGQYCKSSGIKTKIDLTYYGIYSHHTVFCISSEFLIFCSELNVEFLDVDIMA